MKYKIQYISKRGRHITMFSSNIVFVRAKIITLFEQKIEATIWLDDKIVGRVWRDDSQKPKWNYTFDEI